MNYSVLLLKLSKPRTKFFEDDALFCSCCSISSILNKNCSDIFQISVWGNLALDVAQYYKIGDYLIIEGSLYYRKPFWEFWNKKR